MSLLRAQPPQPYVWFPALMPFFTLLFAVCGRTRKTRASGTSRPAPTTTPVILIGNTKAINLEAAWYASPGDTNQPGFAWGNILVPRSDNPRAALLDTAVAPYSENIRIGDKIVAVKVQPELHSVLDANE